MLAAGYNAPVSPPRRVLTSEDFVEVVAFRDAADHNRAIDLTGCLIEAGLRPAGSSLPAALLLSSARDEIEVQDPAAGVAIVRVAREIVTGLGLAGDYDFELRAVRDGVAIAQVTSLRRIVAGVIADRSALAVDGVSIDRAASFETQWRFRRSVFGVLEPVDLTDVTIEGRLTGIEGTIILVFSSRADLIEIADPPSGNAIVRLPADLTALLLPGPCTLTVRMTRGETVTIAARAPAVVL